MDNLNTPAAPFVNYLMSSYEDCDNHPGFTKLELASLIICAAMISRTDAKDSQKNYAQNAVATAKAVLEECNK